MENSIVASYSTERLVQIQTILTKAYTGFPASLILPVERYENALAVNDYFRALKNSIDFFELSVQFLTGVMITFLNHDQALEDERLKKTLSGLFQKPLSNGDWFEIFKNIIEQSNEILPDEKIIRSLYNGLYRSNKREEFKDIYVTVRNTQLAHNTLKSNTIYKGILHKVEPWIWHLLELMLPLADYHFFTLDESFTFGSDTLHFISPDRGLAMLDSVSVKSDRDLKKHRYYISLNKIEEDCCITAHTCIEVPPFVIQQRFFKQENEQRHIYIFQSLKDNSLKRINFISAHEDANAHETDFFKDDFDDFIQTKLNQVISVTDYKISIVQEKTLEQYNELLSNETSTFINSQIKSLKFDPELFVDRNHLSESFSKFLESDCTGLVILGNAGAGKTNQLCHWASAYGDQYIPLAFNAKIFQDNTIKAKFKAVFKDSRSAPEILESLENVLSKSGKLVCILFDAINECNKYSGSEKGAGSINLLLDINDSIVTRNFKHIKTIISCRTYTWDELVDKDDFLKFQNLYYTINDKEEHLTLKGFTETEFSSVYPKYASRYNLITDLVKLSEDRYAFVKRRLFDPLILKTACQVFEERHFPADLRQFNSNNLFELRIKRFKDHFNEKKDKIGEKSYSILYDFSTILWRNSSDNLPVIELIRAYDNKSSNLHELAKEALEDDSGHFKIALRNLIDEGFLRVETGRNGFDELRFVYERLNEYLFALQFIDIESKKQPGKGLLGRDSYEAVLRSSNLSTIIIASLRNALIKNAHEEQDPSTIIELAQSQLYASQVLVEETLSVLIEENYSDVARVIERMLRYKKEESIHFYNEQQKLTQVLARDKKKPKLLEAESEFYDILKVRQIAISVIYKIFRSDYIDTLLDKENISPIDLLWTAMADPLSEVRDTASTYTYYIARYNRELGMRIISALSDPIKEANLLTLLKPSARKKLKEVYIEPACRVSLFIVIDGLIERQDYKLALEILETWKKIVRKLTLNYSIIKMMMPFFKFLFARQTVIQTEYVNNAVEYQHFWDTIKKHGEAQEWSRDAYQTLLPYLGLERGNLSNYETLVLNGYRTGDSFSLFLLERILIIQGVADWNNIAQLVQRIIQLPYHTPYKAYMEMSLIYSLFQINHKSVELIPKAESTFADMVYQWTSQHKGYYFAHYNDRANEGRPYKQYVLYWYGSAYCNRYGDGMSKPGDMENVPVFRRLIYDAYTNRDKALLYYCLDNMAILVSGSGYHKTALQLFEYLIGLFKNRFEIKEFDDQKLEGNLFAKGLRSFICDTLGTVKSYYPKEVDYFIVNKLKASHFPDLDTFREEIVNHSLSHEGLGDLLTHKFGNFLIWGIINDYHIRKFFLEIFEFSYESKDYHEWFNNCIRHIFQELFEVK